MNELATSQWYQNLVDECKDILVELGTNIRLDYLKMWHTVGKRILEDESNFTAGGYTVDGLSQELATSLNVSQRSIQYAILGARKYPTFEDIPLEKNTGWTAFCRLLDGGTKKVEKAKEDYLLCRSCGSEIMPIRIPCGHCGTVFEIRKEDVKRR